MLQWAGPGMCSQEYQPLLLAILLSTSQGTPSIIVHRLLVPKSEMPSLPALTSTMLSTGHVLVMELSQRVI